ncbi:polysaccharide biosynthesis/export family protein [Longimicrobium sp.]|uniref:polysaccharide biosynthesis/export family protein n=1 Tax=Longimicrobium sp. TaxID=2029185 RepID=UPI002E3768DF|nr:polysaccharide biosynthesis/export family protein [Longimicrobium sp.]HEX6038647.1 polysaccharide biosynthesis/export family protein [Longimicrobium sp.]
MNAFRVLCALALMAAGACAPGPRPTTQPLPETGAGVLRPGDAVRVTVYRQEELSGEFAVLGDGTLGHPLYRGVRVAGRPLPDVQAAVGENVGRFVANPQFVVQPLLQVAIEGEVNGPRLYQMPPETTLRQAISLAGGPAARGRLDRVRLIRDNAVYVLDLSSELGSGRTLVHSGDEIFVPRRRDVLREVVQPMASIVAATAALVNLYRTVRAAR